jgi:hypothetical protein
MRGNCVSNVDNSSGTVEKVLERVDTLAETVDMLSKTVDKAGGGMSPLPNMFKLSSNLEESVKNILN